MKLTKDDISHIASLARLELQPGEEVVLAEKLSAILEYVGQLQGVDTDAIDYQYQVDDIMNIMAPDEVVVQDEETRSLILDGMPDRAGDLLKVKGVFAAE